MDGRRSLKILTRRISTIGMQRVLSIRLLRRTRRFLCMNPVRGMNRLERPSQMARIVFLQLEFWRKSIDVKSWLLVLGRR
ncbi:hypothetical protein LB503_009990 [Fusarium chuoi]|nr:hypothetical protein LB503_009990 [Fusarium chuoi]